MKEVVIAGYLRTAQSRSRPTDPARDWFCKMRGDELLAKVLPEVIKRTGIDAEEIDDFVVGCATAVGEQWAYGGRIPIFLANLPEDASRPSSSTSSAARPWPRSRSGSWRSPRISPTSSWCGGYEHMTRVAMGMANVDRGPASRPTWRLFLDPALPALGHDDHHEHGVDGRKADRPGRASRARRLDKWGVRSHQLAAKAQAERVSSPARSCPSRPSRPTAPS